MLLKAKRWFFLMLYYGFAFYLPDSYLPLLGKISNKLRILCVKNIFKKCGKIRTINRKVYFGNGQDIIIDDDSGIGARTEIPNNLIVGKNVIISRDVFILSRNHRFDSTEIPINNQGFYEKKATIIEDDCWIGLRVIVTPGRIIKRGSIVGMGAVLTKDFPPYCISGGNPAKIIRHRK